MRPGFRNSSNSGINKQAGFLGVCDFSGRLQAELVSFAKMLGTSIISISEGPFAALAKTDTTNGPFIMDRDNVLGVVHGEIYRIDEMTRRWCPDSSGEAATADIVAGAYINAGLGGLTAVDGLFATVFWDRQRRETIVYRDGSCARFLYHAQLSPETLAFATEIEDLFSVLKIPKILSRRSLHEYLRFLDISTPNTIYEGVYSAEPGIPLRFDGSEIQQEEQASRPAGKTIHDLEDATTKLDRVLGESVADRLDRKSTTGFFLSGGVDSSLLLSIAAGLGQGGIEAFTVGFEKPPYDETAVAARVAKHLGVRHNVLRFPVDRCRKEFRRFLATADQPFADPAGLPTFLALEECGHSVRTMIDGTGADTLVGVMPARFGRLATQYAALLPRSIRTAVARGLRDIPSLAGYQTIFDFDEPQEILIRWKGWRRGEIERLCGEPVFLQHTRFYRIYSCYNRKQHLERYSALLGNLPDDRVHQASRASGVKVRFPFWDPRVISLIKSLPLRLRYRKKESKPILKALLVRRVPRLIWDLPKHGFDFPFMELMSANGHALLNEFLDLRDIRKEGIWSPEVVQGYVERFTSGDAEQGFRIWALLVFRAWYAEHFDHP